MIGLNSGTVGGEKFRLPRKFFGGYIWFGGRTDERSPESFRGDEDVETQRREDRKWQRNESAQYPKAPLTVLLGNRSGNSACFRLIQVNSAYFRIPWNSEGFRESKKGDLKQEDRRSLPVVVKNDQPRGPVKVGQTWSKPVKPLFLSRSASVRHFVADSAGGQDGATS
jgi:hypothetical protein